MTVTQEEFAQLYGKATERREELYSRFREWLSAAQSTGALRRVWVFGSYATRKPGPGDLEILALFGAGFDLTTVPPEQRHWFDHEMCRSIHEMDLFFLTEAAPPEVLAMTLDTFGRDRSGQKSIVEITL